MNFLLKDKGKFCRAARVRKSGRKGKSEREVKSEREEKKRVRE